MNPVPHIVQFLIWLINAVIRQESIGTIAWQIVSRIPGLIAAMLNFRDFTQAAQVDALLKSADNHLGSDPEAVDLLKSLPDDMEEELTDAVLTVTEILVKNSLRLEGYHTDPKH